MRTLFEGFKKGNRILRYGCRQCDYVLIMTTIFWKKGEYYSREEIIQERTIFKEIRCMKIHKQRWPILRFFRFYDPLHSMAMGHLYISKETAPMTNTALKVAP